MVVNNFKSRASHASWGACSISSSCFIPCEREGSDVLEGIHPSEKRPAHKWWEERWEERLEMARKNEIDRALSSNIWERWASGTRIEAGLILLEVMNPVHSTSRVENNYSTYRKDSPGASGQLGTFRRIGVYRAPFSYTDEERGDFVII
jgi:hypothetical protein